MKIFDNYLDWECTEHVAKHKPTGLTFWVANGWTFFNGYKNTPLSSLYLRNGGITENL